MSSTSSPQSKKQQRLNRHHQSTHSNLPLEPDPNASTSFLEVPPSLQQKQPCPISPTTKNPKATHHPRRKLTKFHLFPALPKDLRLLIWEHTLADPITHHVTLVRCDTGREWTTFIPPSQKPSRVPLAWISNEPSEGAGEVGLPIGLFVNKEIADFVMSLYENTNVWERHKSWRAERWGWRRIWLQSRKDELFVDRKSWRCLQGERIGMYNIVGGVLSRIGVRRVLVELEDVHVETVGREGIEERKRKQGERNTRQILEVLDVFDGVIEVGLVIVGRSTDVSWMGVAVCARKERGGDWFVGGKMITF